MKNLLNTLLTTVMLMAAWPAFSQVIVSYDMIRDNSTFTLKAEVADSVTGQPVAFASAYMIPVKDTLITSFALTSPDGKVELKDITKGEYDFTVEFMGYVPFHKRIYMRKGIDLKKILLKPDIKALTEAKVTAAVDPVEIKNDTIIYNAAAFRTLSNGKLVDLLKQMPGVEVSDNGSVKVNGKTVSQITVEGKTFFMGNNTWALNSLPSSVVNKVKVTEKESEAAEFSGIKGDGKQTVMDVELKEEYKRGVFGTLSAGGGTTVKGNDKTGFKDYKKGLFRTSNMLSAYGDKNQLTAIANGYNVVGMNSVHILSFDDGGDDKTIDPEGVHTQWQTGVNLNTDEIKGMSTDVSATFSSNSGETRRRTLRTTFMDSGDDVSDDNMSSSTGDMKVFKAQMEMKNKNRKKYTFRFAPEFKWSDYSESVSGESASEVLGEVKNTGKTSSVENRKTIYTYGRLTAGVKNLGKERRSLTVNGSYSYGNYDGDSKEYSSTWYSRDDSSIERNLFYDKSGRNWSYGGSMQYVEPIGKSWAVQGMLSSYYRVRTSGDDAFNAADGSVNDYYTSISENYYWTSYARLLAQFNRKSTNLQFGGLVRFVSNENYAKSYGLETRTGKDEWTVAWSPFLKFTTNVKGRTYRANYEFDTERPSAASIIPSFNILNPTRITAGNIYLKPSVKHDYSVNMSGKLGKTDIRYYFYYSGGFEKDSRVSAIWFDKDNIRYSIPVNSRKPGWDNTFDLSLSRKISKNGRWNANLYGDLNFTRNVSYQSTGRLEGINPDNVDYGSFMDAFWGDESGNRFYSGESGFHESLTDGLYYNISANVRYSGDSFSVRTGFGINGDKTSYSLDSSADVRTMDYYVSAGADYSAPLGFEFRTLMSYNMRSGYGKGYNDPYMNWNLSVNKNVKAFTFSLEFMDILDQQKVRRHAVRENYVQDSFVNRLGRSIVLSLTWNFGKMNAARSSSAQDAVYNLSM